MHKLRAALTILGIIIGVAAVLTTMGIGRGATSNITERIQSQGTNLLVIIPGASNVGGAAGSRRISAHSDHGRCTGPSRSYYASVHYTAGAGLWL
ncbi:MAG: ABC transporter permease [Anaerolineae bacterium]|nr:ABC transporter permease [Anaerolineae bacterium]